MRAARSSSCCRRWSIAAAIFVPRAIAEQVANQRDGPEPAVTGNPISNEFENAKRQQLDSMCRQSISIESRASIYSRRA